MDGGSKQKDLTARLLGGEDVVETSPKVADEVKCTTCYMCACRCGIKVHLKDGRIRYIEGNRDHPVNRGVLCAKGSAGIMQHYSPAKLRSRCCASASAARANSGRSSGTRRWRSRPTGWARSARRDPKKLAFFTGRDQSQALTGWWAAQFGTPNFAAHGGFCSVNMAAARALLGRRQLLGVRRAGLGAHAILPDVRRGRGPRLQPDQARRVASSRSAARRSSRSTRCAPATRRSPTNGSASGPAPTGCWCAR